MAVNVPMPGMPGQALMEGLNTGSGLFQKIIQNRLTQAQTQKEQQFGGLSNLSGTARDAASLNMLKGIMGESHPTYQQALKAFELEQSRKEELNRSSEFYRNNPWRLYDPTTKSMQAQMMAAQGQFPEGGTAYNSPDEAQNAVNVYERERYGKNPNFIQQQALAASQIDATLGLIDPDVAFSRSGLKGQIQLGKDIFNSGLKGEAPSKEYLAAEEQQSYLHALVEQMRTYLGASISPGMTENLNYLVNPNNIKNHPEIAKAKLNAVIRAYEKEKEKTQQALTTGNPLGQQPLYSPTKMGQPANQNAIGSIPNEVAETASTMGLNITPDTISRENVTRTAKLKGWSKEKEQAILKKLGYK